MAIKFDQIIDDRNMSLYNKVTAMINVNVIEYEVAEAMHKHTAGSSTIFMPRTDTTPETFTHELLHAKIAALGYSIYDDIYDLVLSNSKLCQMITTPLVSHIANCLEHLHMHDHYLAMGYDKRKFITDYDLNKCDSEELILIKTHFRVGSIYNAIAIDAYIGRFFSYRCCFNNSHDYTACAATLRTLDVELYLILDNFLSEWQKIDILNSKANMCSHYKIIIKLTNALIKWANFRFVA